MKKKKVQIVPGIMPLLVLAEDHHGRTFRDSCIHGECMGYNDMCFFRPSHVKRPTFATYCFSIGPFIYLPPSKMTINLGKVPYMASMSFPELLERVWILESWIWWLWLTHSEEPPSSCTAPIRRRSDRCDYWDLLIHSPPGHHKSRRQRYALHRCSPRSEIKRYPKNNLWLAGEKDACESPAVMMISGWS